MIFKDYKKLVCETDLDDSSALLNLGRRWKKIDDKKEFNAKIAILGSASIQLVSSVTRALLTKYDIYADIYEGEYNGILMDILDSKSKLYSFNPNYLVIIPDYRDIIDNKPQILASNKEIDNAVSKVTEKYLDIFRTVHEKLSNCQILFSNFVKPYFDSLGNLASNYIFSQSIFFDRINLELIKNRPSYVNILDFERLSGYVGKKNWFDDSSYYLNKSAFSLEYIGYYCDVIARQFEAFSGKIRKCLVLDLDNTLWGGIVGDLGYDGINIDPNDAEGEAFLQFQKYLLNLKDRGVILAVCSKNDLENAKEPFEKNPNMIIKLEDISSFVANWADKATNINQIAKNLNIGVDSIVFFDDNPTERMLVKEFLPEVKVVEVPDDPAQYMKALDQAFCFEWNQITEEDIRRNQSYLSNGLRENLLEHCSNYDEYLQKLQMTITFESVSDKSLPRFVQLTNKSNQFNLRTVRYTEADIAKMLNRNEYSLFTVSLKDKFSNYGIIACIVLHFEKDVCFIENWVMSCRVLKKGIENYSIEKIVETAKKHGCKKIIGEYLKTKKNSMVEKLYEDLGFNADYISNDKSMFSLDEQSMESYSQSYYFEEE